MKKVGFNYTNAPARKQIVFEQIFGEKVGGGMVANSDVDLAEGLAVGKNSDGMYAPIKGLVVVEAAESSASTIKVAKGSGVKAGEFYALADKAVAVSAVDTTSNDKFDVLTISLGTALVVGDVLYQAAGASESEAAPIYVPEYILGEDIPAESGDMLVKLVNGANLRKESAPVADAVVALMKNIIKI